MIAGATFDIERASFSSGAVGIKRVTVRLLIVSVARKLAPCTHPNDFTAWLGARAAGRAIGIEFAGDCFRARKHQCHRSKEIYRAELISTVAKLHTSPNGPTN